MKLILIEGVPGSGKSTMAEKLCTSAISMGISATWYLEESKTHPIHPHDGSRDNLTPEYFLSRWEDFISLNKNRDHLFILEGSLFQSTVRFLMEENNGVAIVDYFKRCQLILANCPAELIYLRPPDISNHISWTASHRGERWRSLVTSYLEGTPFCIERSWQGPSTLNKFWSYYAELCDELVLKSKIPTCTINAGLGYFEQQHSQAEDYSNLVKGL